MHTSANVVHPTGVEERTPPRTHKTRGTDAHISRARLTRHQRTCVGSSVSGIAPLSLKKVIFISSMVHGMLLNPHVSPHFSSPFSTPFSAPTPLSTPSLLNSSTSPNPCATPQEGLFCRLAEQSPLTSCASLQNMMSLGSTAPSVTV